MPLLCPTVATDTANAAPRYMCHPFGCTPELMKGGRRPKKVTHMSSLILHKTNSRPQRRKKEEFQVPAHGIMDAQKGFSVPRVLALMREGLMKT